MACCKAHPDSKEGRRHFLARCAGLAVGLVLPSLAVAGRLRQFSGEVAINGTPVVAGADIRPLDVITTGAKSNAIVVVGMDALLVRANSEVELLGKPDAATLTGLRMLEGALLGVFGTGAPRQLLTATATAEIRGTGIYVEASAQQTYFCTCYGEVELSDQHRSARKLVRAGYHAANVIHADAAAGAVMQDAEVSNHTDEELVMLERLFGRRPAFGSQDKLTTR